MEITGEALSQVYELAAIKTSSRPLYNCLGRLSEVMLDPGSWMLE
jgi:hypothetical protein